MQAAAKFSKRLSFFIVALILALFLILLFVFQRYVFVPKIIVLLLIVLGAALMRKLPLLIKDWFVFISFVYLFDSLRGSIYILTCKLGLPVHATYVIGIEKALFGQVPSVILQARLLDPAQAPEFTWLERALTAFHGSHFLAFLLIGFIVWLSKSGSFRLFRTSYYLLIFLGVLGYFLVPTVPPWMASKNFGLLPPLIRFNGIIFNFAIPDLSTGFDTNPIAAMPSLHAAFPLLSSLLLWHLYRWRALPFYIYTAIVLFTIVYTGDHYITDILAGSLLAVACYFLAIRHMKSRPSIGSEATTTGVKGPKFDPGGLAKPLLKGLAVLLLGVCIGAVNKVQFTLNASSYGLNAPRYADFFKHEETYRANYKVQDYLGNHFLLKRDYAKALPYFERCLSLAADSSEKSQAQYNLSHCRGLLGRNN
jgi:membrane-associated phospholipid phosphatase